MIGVVRKGTGTSAAIPGVTVAGKTGTAELKSQCTPLEPKPAIQRIRSAKESSSQRLRRRRQRSEQHRRLVRVVRAGAAARASSSACCSSKTAPAATPPRRSRAKCSKPALQARRAVDR